MAALHVVFSIPYSRHGYVELLHVIQSLECQLHRDHRVHMKEHNVDAVCIYFVKTVQPVPGISSST